jgi:hypothetical protein
MTSSRIRKSILLLVALAAGAGSLLVAAGSALALEGTALFRIEQRWHGFPSPPVTTPGNAGMYQGYLLPYYLEGQTKTGNYAFPPATADVVPLNPIGAPFTLPRSVQSLYSIGTITPKTGWPGYTTTYWYYVYNGTGMFKPNNGPTAPYRMMFPTTGMNYTKTEPNLGLGNPLTPTTTFDGRYDVTRGGSLHVDPGTNRFGGTFRLFYFQTPGPNGYTAHWDQNITYFTPALYFGHGEYFCFDNGVYDCTASTFVSVPGTTQQYNGTWWLLTSAGVAKATTPTAPGDASPTPYGNASYLRREQHYFNFIHPWTTGAAKAVFEGVNQGTGQITPQGTGYDISLGDADISVPIIRYNQDWNKTLQTLTSSTTTPYTQILKGVTRVVSMVRPRLTWTVAVPLDPGQDPVETIWNPVRLTTLKVYFLPEPAGMLALGIGIASLLGLSRMRRR